MAKVKRKVSSPESAQPEIKPFWNIEEHGVTQGLLGLFSICPQKATYRLKNGYTTGATSVALNFGDVFHRCLDMVYQLSSTEAPEKYAWDCEECIDVSLNHIYREDKIKLMDSLANPTQLLDLELNVAIAGVMLHSYFKRWRTDFSDMKWVDLEKTFEVPYNGIEGVTIPVRGKYDGVFLDRKGKHWLFETKTKSQIDDGSISDKLNFDLQVMLYLWTMRQMYNTSPMGVIYNIVRRPQLRQKKNESIKEFVQRIEEDVDQRPEFYFVRYTATILKEELDDWVERDFSSLMSQVYAWSKNLFNYRNTGACQLWNRPCEFMRSCAYGDVSYLQKREHVFPELAMISAGDSLGGE